MTEELRVIITAEVDKLRQEINKGKKEVENFSKKSKASFSEFNDAVQKAGDVAKSSMKIAAGAIAATATALLALGSSTEEYRKGQAKLITAFEAAGSSAATAEQTYNDLYRVLGDSDVSVEAANHLAKLTTNQKDLQQWTKICQGVYATFGDSLPIEGLTEAANETARVGQVTGPLADALNWAGVSEDEFNEKLLKCANTQEREALIRETLNGLYSDAAKGYEKNAKDIIKQNEAQAKLNKSTAKLGETMAPLNTMLTEFATEVLAEITPHLTAFAEEYGPAIKDALLGIAEAIGNVLTWVIDNWELVSTIAIVIGTITTALSIFSTVMAIVNAVMAASPVTWIVLAIVAAIAALVAIIILVIKYWDEIKAVAVAVWEAIKEAWDKAVQFFKDLWDKIIQFCMDAWDGIKSVFSGVANWFNETLIQPVANFFKGMWDGLKNGARNAWNGIKSVFSGITNWFKDKFSQAWQAVKNVFSVGGKIFDGIKDGIVSAFRTVVNAIITGINKVISIPFKTINGILNGIRSINILGVEPFSGLWGKNPLPVPQIPKLAQGGIVDSATIAMIGEEGKEAIVPLENNTEWIDKLAAKISGPKNSKPAKIVLNVDGKTFAQTAINTINDLTAQTGSLNLNLV
jgi:phage-related protein